MSQEEFVRERVWVGVWALVVGVGGVVAQERPTEGGHAHAPEQPAGGGAAEADEEGPNLQIPVWVGGRARERLEAAITTWEAVYRDARRGRGSQEALEGVIEELEALRDPALRCALPDYYLGIARQLTGEHDEAVRRLRAAIRILPGFHEAMVELGDAHRWNGDEREARGAYGEAIEANPDYAHAYRMRAMLSISQQRFEDAREDATRAAELAPRNVGIAVLKRQLDLVMDGPSWETGYEVETRHYVVRTNVSQEFCEEIANQAELIRRLYLQIFPRPPRSRTKSPIVVFASREEYHRNGGPQGAGGHFDPQFKQLFLFQYDDPEDTRLVLYHEGFHQFLDGVLETKPPQWFNEGLADFFGPSEYVNEGGDEGMRLRPNPWRLRTVQQMIRRGQDVPFERLMTMSQAEMYQREAAGRHYAQAWSIVYFLARADDGAHFDFLADYFRALRRGKDRMEAYEDTFGDADMEAMQQRWREFTLGLRQD